MEQTWQSPFNNIEGKGPSYAERNADQTSGTNGYGGNIYFSIQVLIVANTLGIRDPLRLYQLFTLLGNARLIPIL